MAGVNKPSVRRTTWEIAYAFRSHRASNVSASKRSDGRRGGTRRRRQRFQIRDRGAAASMVSPASLPPARRLVEMDGRTRPQPTIVPRDPISIPLFKHITFLRSWQKAFDANASNAKDRLQLGISGRETSTGAATLIDVAKRGARKE